MFEHFDGSEMKTNRGRTENSILPDLLETRKDSVMVVEW
jgi:hypothetical protein